MKNSKPENCPTQNVDGVRSKSQPNKTLPSHFAYAAAKTLVEYTLLMQGIDVARPMQKHDPHVIAKIDGEFLKIRVVLNDGKQHKPAACGWLGPDVLAVVSSDKSEIEWLSADNNKPLPQMLQRINEAVRETETPQGVGITKDATGENNDGRI